MRATLPAMSIYLIRHGETPSNVARVLQTAAMPLSQLGIEQARRLAGRLAGAGIKRILSSDLRRAEMTARAIHDATEASIQFQSLLQERNFGDLRGTAYDDFEEDPFGPDFVPPAGESWEAFHERVDKAWEQVQQTAASISGNLAVVTHGLVCRRIVTHHAQLPEGVEVDSPFQFGNTSLTVIANGAPWQVETLACTAHLKASESPDGTPV
jgi:probable phosphoglycerate mutase